MENAPIVDVYADGYEITIHGFALSVFRTGEFHVTDLRYGREEGWLLGSGDTALLRRIGRVFGGQYDSRGAFAAALYPVLKAAVPGVAN